MNWTPVNVALVKVGMQVVETDGSLLEVVAVRPSGRSGYALTLKSMMGEVEAKVRAGKMIRVFSA